MRIIGIGVDIVDNKRIKKSIKNKKFIARIFSKNEINLSKKFIDKINYFSKRFAAKESLSKALGTGFAKGLNFKDISIVNDKYGKPHYELSSKVKKIVYSKYKVKKANFYLSLSDEKKYSIAFTLISTN